MSVLKTKKPDWDYYPQVWKTEAEYLSWLRGQFRQIWKNSPQRALFLKANVKRIPVLDDQGKPVTVKKTGFPKFVNGYECAYCKAQLKASGKVEGSKYKPLYAVDHIVGGHSLRTFDDVGSFVKAIISVRPTDLQILCHICHDIKTHSEKIGISFEMATYDKVAISLVNAKTDKDFFLERSLPVPSNQKLRREGIVKVLEQENKKNKRSK